MFKYIALLLGLSSLPLALTITKYEKCKGNGGGLIPDWVHIDGCPEAPCDFYEGDFLTASTGFAAPYDTTNLTARLDAYKLGIRIEFDLPPEAIQACEDLEKGNCPVELGEELVYGFAVELEGIPLTASVTIEFALMADHGKNFACARFAAKVYSKPRTPSINGFR